MAGPTYPELFAPLGTPLYQADEKFSRLPLNHTYSFAVERYHQDQKQALELHKTGDKGAYLQELRKLSKAHDAILSTLKQEIMKAVKENDHRYFLDINNAEIDILYQQENFKTQVYEYYLQNKNKYESAYLDGHINAEKGYQKLYGVDITSNAPVMTLETGRHSTQKILIFLSTTWCGQCQKAKKYLREKGIVYTEYDAEKSQKGRSLMQQYHGTGYPTFIIGNESISGLNKSWIQERL